MVQLRTSRKRFVPLFVCLVILAILITACGGSSSEQSASAPASTEMKQKPSTGNNPSDSARTESEAPAVSDESTSQMKPGDQKLQSTVITGQQYLIKSLHLSLQVKDTRKVADEVLGWITRTDQNATTSSSSYRQSGDDNYYVSLTFSVPTASYDAVYRYLRDYTVTNKDGKMTSFQETTQDVSATYIDVEARLSNLRKEQTRVQELLNRAQTLNEVIIVESKLTEIEGQIESYQAQMNSLKNQTSFYTVSVDLTPLNAPTKPQPTEQGWSIGQILQDAFNASLSFGRAVVTLLVWLLAFSIYILPIVALAWFVQRWRWRRLPFFKNLARPKASPAHTSINTPVTSDPIPPVE